jgi:septum formation protein
MLAGLQGREHEVFTGLAVATAEESVSTVDITAVRILSMTEDEIYGYVETGEPMDKAGAYGLQGRGGVFVESIVGSPFTVIGLPIHLIPRLMRKVGVVPEQFAKRSNL